MNEIVAKLYSRGGYVARECVTTSANSDVKVVERFCKSLKPGNGNYFPYSKQVFLSSKSPLREAGVDSFRMVKTLDGKKLISKLDKNGNFLTKTGLASEVRGIIKAIKRYGLKLI